MMRITTLGLDEPRPCDMDVPLRRLAASAEPLKAACWQKLVDLVAHLQSRDSERELWGQIMSQELWLRSVAPPDPIRDMQVKKLRDELLAQNPDPTTWGDRLSREMMRRFPPRPGIHVSVRVDWRDYAPLRNGLPEMHYRFQIRRPGKSFAEDARAKDVVEAERVICETFGW